MVELVKSIAAHVGAVCYADPFLPTTADMVEESALTRASRRLAGFTSRQMGGSLSIAAAAGEDNRCRLTGWLKQR